MSDTDDITLNADSAEDTSEMVEDMVGCIRIGYSMREPFKCIFCANGGGYPLNQHHFLVSPNSATFFTSSQTPFLALFRRPCLVPFGPFQSRSMQKHYFSSLGELFLGLDPSLYGG